MAQCKIQLLLTYIVISFCCVLCCVSNLYWSLPSERFQLIKENKYIILVRCKEHSSHLWHFVINHFTTNNISLCYESVMWKYISWAVKRSDIHITGEDGLILAQIRKWTSCLASGFLLLKSTSTILNKLVDYVTIN